MAADMEYCFCSSRYKFTTSIFKKLAVQYLTDGTSEFRRKSVVSTCL